MNRTILITGASSGIGKAIAYRFAKEHWKLILVARRLNRLEEIRKALSNNKILIESIDVRDKKSIGTFLSNLPDEFKCIDVLCNNAGLDTVGALIHESNTDDWDTVVDVNIKGVLNFIGYILPSMVKRNSGHIVNIGSIGGSYPYPKGNIYASTKAFIKLFTKQLKADLFGTAIRVTNIEPGITETEFPLVRHRGNREKADKTYEGMRPLKAEDIAEAVYWAVNMPEYVNVNSIEIMPVDQAWGPFNIKREN
jgi:NADP-dependent 3-hydroxy acid dehydrogenase YdfG